MTVRTDSTPCHEVRRFSTNRLYSSQRRQYEQILLQSDGQGDITVKQVTLGPVRGEETVLIFL